MKKLIISLLLCAMMLPTLAACGGSTDTGAADTTAANAETNEAAETTTEEERITDDLPSDLNYNGYEFKVHSRYAPLYFAYTISTAEENGDVVNDAMYARDRALEERLNIKFIETTYDNATQGQEVPKTLIMAGDDTYDLYVARNVQSFTWAAEGLIVDWNKLDYVDLDKPYWDKSINEAFVLNDKIFFAAGASNLTSYEFTHSLLFNKTLRSSLSLDDPYELVLDGSWTYDEFSKMAKAAVSDINGDGVMNIEDRYGLLSIPKQVLPGFWIGAGTQTIERDSDGKFVYSTPENEKFITVYNRVIADMYDDKAWMVTPPSGSDSGKEPDYFSEGKGLFLNANFFRISTLRAMETDFGILPYPKWEESQDKYIGRIEGCELPLVPMTNKDLSRTGAILEALSSESLDTVVTAYYDKALTGKYARDEESLEMLEIIMANRVFDYGDTILCSQIRDGVIRHAYESNNRDIVSALVANAGSVNGQLQILNKDY